MFCLVLILARIKSGSAAKSCSRLNCFVLPKFTVSSDNSNAENNEKENAAVSEENLSDNETKVEETAKISINTATKEELMKLDGIGESKAENIIKYREENGNFKTIEDIKNVSGIGDAAYEKIKDSITI